MPCEALQLRNAFLSFISLAPGNGYISTDTLKEILKELDNKLTEEDLNGIIEEVDEDGSGTLDFDGRHYASIHKRHCVDESPPFFRVYGHDGRLIELL